MRIIAKICPVIMPPLEFQSLAKNIDAARAEDNVVADYILIECLVNELRRQQADIEDLKDRVHSLSTTQHDMDD